MNAWLEKLSNVDWGQATALLITGMLVVFTALIVLVIIFAVFGKIMEKASGAPKSPKAEKVKEPKKEAPKMVKVVADAGLSDEIVAAITGAISAILTEEGNTGSFVIKSIKRTRKAIGGWRKSGILENIREF